MTKKFDPAEYIRTVKYKTRDGGVVEKQILDTGPRLAWFRSEHPIEDGWCIVTHCTRLDENGAQFRAEIFDAEGRLVSTGHRLVYAKDFRNHGEKAETQAIGRALATAGYGTLQVLDVEDDNGPDELPDTPIEKKSKEGPGAPPQKEQSAKVTVGLIQEEANAHLEARGLEPHYKNRVHTLKGMEACGYDKGTATKYLSDNFADIVACLVDRVVASKIAEEMGEAESYESETSE